MRILSTGSSGPDLPFLLLPDLFWSPVRAPSPSSPVSPPSGSILAFCCSVELPAAPVPVPIRTIGEVVDVVVDLDWGVGSAGGGVDACLLLLFDPGCTAGSALEARAFALEERDVGNAAACAAAPVRALVDLSPRGSEFSFRYRFMVAT